MVKKLILSTLSILLLAISYMLYAKKSAYADFSLGIYPPIIQIQATVPVGIKKDFTVVNAGETPRDVSVVLRQFTTSPYNAGQVSYLPDYTVPHPDKDIFQKIQIVDGEEPVDTLILAPKQKKTLTLRIGLPKNEPAGDYYFSILFLSTDGANTTHNGSTINAGIATNVLLSIGPKDQTTGFLDEFSSPWFLQTGPVPFTVSVANTSNHFITPNGQILIRNMFGQLVGKVDLLPVNILEQTSRFIPSKDQIGKSTISNQSLGSPQNKPVGLWGEKVLFGPYSAHIIISLSDQGPLFTRTIYFFAMPWEYLVGAAVAVLLIWIVVERVRKRIRSI